MAEHTGSAYPPDATAGTSVTGRLFTFTGFFFPIEQPPAVNTRRAGQIVEMQFSLGGDAGLDVFAPGYPLSRRRIGGTLTPLGTAQPTATVGGLGLQYIKATGRYWYVWQTDPAWRTTSRTFTMRLTDGTTHTALFMFP
jgi:hypothetical protein